MKERINRFFKGIISIKVFIWILESAAIFHFLFKHPDDAVKILALQILFTIAMVSAREFTKIMHILKDIIIAVKK